MKKLVIFDLDGTLLNTIADLGASCNYALESMGMPTHPIQTYNYMVGNGVRRLLERAQPDADASTVDELLVRFRSHYDEHNCDATTPYPGVHKLLLELHKLDVAIAVATNKYQSAAERIIGHFFPEIPFVGVFGQTDTRPVKPDPSVIFDILTAHPTPKAEVLMVGDSAVDIETAKRACVANAGVTWGFRPVSELRRAFADNIVSRPTEIINLLQIPL